MLLLYESGFGEYEPLLDDSTRFAAKAKAASVEVTLTVGEGMIHCYPLLAPLFPEAAQAGGKEGQGGRGKAASIPNIKFRKSNVCFTRIDSRSCDSPHIRQAMVAWLSASTSSGDNENESAPAFSAACLAFFAPGMGSTVSFSINQRRPTWLGLLE